jgi:DNA invertase Pin-like site-specific DNA recombinase
MSAARARIVLYVRVSTEEQAAQGNGLEAQLAQLQRESEHHQWTVVETIRDEGVSGKDLVRPGLKRALELIAEGKADGLAVAKLDRLSRSVIDAGMLAEWFEEVGARLVALDLNIDTNTPSGRMIFSVLSAVAQWERETIAQRTKDGLAALRAKGKPTGRPAVADRPELFSRIALMRARGMTLQAIADQLNAERVPTIRGGATWRPSSVEAAAGYKRRRPRRKHADLPKPLRRAA